MLSTLETRVHDGPAYKITELPLPQADWMVLTELARDMPQALAQGREADALDWLEHIGSTYSYALSPELHEVMDSIREGTDTAVLLLTSEDPEGSIDQTPYDHLTPAENKLYLPDMCRGILVGAFALHGYGYTSQQHGVIFNNMIVAQSQRNSLHVASSVNPLGMHTEDSAYAEGDNGGMSPDVLSLHYFKNSERVSTPVSVPNLGALSDEIREELFVPQFYIPNSPAQGGSQNETSNKVSVLFGDPEHPAIRFNASLMPLFAELQGPKAMSIINTLIEYIEAQKTTLVMQPGDILFINNRYALHGKGKHTWEAPAGKGRWQRRLALTKDLNRILAYCDEPRIVNPDRYKALHSSHI